MNKRDLVREPRIRTNLSSGPADKVSEIGDKKKWALCTQISNSYGLIRNTANSREPLPPYLISVDDSSEESLAGVAAHTTVVEMGNSCISAHWTIYGALARTTLNDLIHRDCFSFHSFLILIKLLVF